MNHPTKIVPSFVNLKSVHIPAQHQLAYHFRPSSTSTDKPAVLFCNDGFQSTMDSTKALALEEFCRSSHLAYCRFDYQGHGASKGKDSLNCTFSDWVRDTQIILMETPLRNHDNVIVVRSSMGAWITMIR